MDSSDAAASLVILVGAWVISLLILYAIIKAAVKNAILEAGAANGPHHYVCADIRHNRSAEFEATPVVPTRSDQVADQPPTEAPNDPAP